MRPAGKACRSKRSRLRAAFSHLTCPELQRATIPPAYCPDGSSRPPGPGGTRWQGHPCGLAAGPGVAAARSAPVFSRVELMRAWEAAGTPPREMLHSDGLHHNDRGYACVAEALASAILRGLRGAAPVMAAGR